MDKLQDNSKTERLMSFLLVTFLTGIVVVCLVMLALEEFDDLGFWKTIWILGLLAGVIDTCWRWKQCRKNLTKQFLIVTLMTISPSIIAIVVQLFIGWCIYLSLDGFYPKAK